MSEGNNETVTPTAQELENIRRLREENTRREAEQAETKARDTRLNQAKDSIALAINELLNAGLIKLEDVDRLTDSAKARVEGYSSFKQEQERAAEEEAHSPANWTDEEYRAFVG